MKKYYTRPLHSSLMLCLASVWLSMLISSCGKDNNPALASGNVIVINEGGFMHSSASISIYDPISKAIANNVFSNTNGGALLGDVTQSVYLIGDTAYIVMNNSRKIVVADAKNAFRYINTINFPGASSPRFFLPVDDHRAYVTELYNNKIWIVDYRRDSVIGSIAMRGWTEQIVSCLGKVYVAEMTKPNGTDTVHKILKIDPLTNNIVSSIDLATDANSIALTDQNKLFVLTSPKTNPTVNSSLYVIDINSFSVERKLDFAAGHSPTRIRFSSFSHELLYTDNGIYRMQPTDNTLPTSAFIASDNWTVYGLNADPSNGDIYIADVIDYQQASHILRYGQTGTLVDEFHAGIITNGFVFK